MSTRASSALFTLSNFLHMILNVRMDKSLLLSMARTFARINVLSAFCSDEIIKLGTLEARIDTEEVTDVRYNTRLPD